MSKQKKMANKSKNNSETKRSLILKDDEHEYAVVLKELGGCRFKVRMNMKDTEVIARLCGKFKKGKMRKDNTVEVGNLVLIGFRDYQDNMYDITFVYNTNESRKLKKDRQFIDITENAGIDYDNDDIGLEIDETFDFDEI
jgi:translation initiation factor 1A